MAQFIATASSINSKAEELAKLNGQLKTQIAALETKVQEANTMWEGDARDTFNSAFHRDKAKLDAYYNAIQTYCQVLSEVAVTYQNSENKNIQIAGGQ